jgi:hypothetical protein
MSPECSEWDPPEISPYVPPLNIPEAVFGSSPEEKIMNRDCRSSSSFRWSFYRAVYVTFNGSEAQGEIKFFSRNRRANDRAAKPAID